MIETSPKHGRVCSPSASSSRRVGVETQTQNKVNTVKGGKKTKETQSTHRSAVLLVHGKVKVFALILSEKSLPECSAAFMQRSASLARREVRMKRSYERRERNREQTWSNGERREKDGIRRPLGDFEEHWERHSSTLAISFHIYSVRSSNPLFMHGEERKENRLFQT